MARARSDSIPPKREIQRSFFFKKKNRNWKGVPNLRMGRGHDLDGAKSDAPTPTVENRFPFF